MIATYYTEHRLSNWSYIRTMHVIVNMLKYVCKCACTNSPSFSFLPTIWVLKRCFQNQIKWNEWHYIQRMNLCNTYVWTYVWYKPATTTSMIHIHVAHRCNEDILTHKYVTCKYISMWSSYKHLGTSCLCTRRWLQGASLGFGAGII